MNSEVPEQGLVKIITSEGLAETRESPEAPKVDPRVSAEQAVKALENWPGGDRVIARLREEGYKI